MKILINIGSFLITYLILRIVFDNILNSDFILVLPGWHTTIIERGEFLNWGTLGLLILGTFTFWVCGNLLRKIKNSFHDSK